MHAVIEDGARMIVRLGRPRKLLLVRQAVCPVLYVDVLPVLLDWLPGLSWRHVTARDRVVTRQVPRREHSSKSVCLVRTLIHKGSRGPSSAIGPNSSCYSSSPVWRSKSASVALGHTDPLR
ncbi:hypothetical protein GY45DRAFT_1323557, partial [Cubamyces sp. BRFM 1775]